MLTSIVKRLAGPAILMALASPALAVDGHEPPVNPFLADSPWPISHRTPYAQASSPLDGPISASQVASPDYVSTGITNITLATSSPYPRPYRLSRFLERIMGSYLDRQWGKPRVSWGSAFGVVYKLRDNRMVDSISKPSGASLDNLSNATSGAYTLIDKDNTFFTVDGITVLAYQDKERGNIDSGIKLRSSFTLPASSLRGDAKTDPIVGMNILWDGRLALATKRGTVAVLNRDFSQFWSVKLGQADAGEEVSNSIAADEKGGIYVVTERAMYRVQWTGYNLSMNEYDGAWRADYEAGEGQSAGRLGKGSGSTPSLMGNPDDADRFVVITDGQDLSHLVLFWRDEIPNSWEQLPGTKSRRIAAQVPVDFGDALRERTVSEQSVLVRGYGAVVVSNDYQNTIEPDPANYPILGGLLDNPAVANINNALWVTLSQFPEFQPWGVQKFQWNPATRTLEKAWVNMNTSCPNGIPTMSASVNTFYCIGAYMGSWTIEGLDWTTGNRRFTKLLGWNPLFNSFYAGTQIGVNGSIISGTTFGVMAMDGK
ncbi:MAG: hypothetical protein P1U78_07600 [Alcanivoracaceae bacterium]|nr:hypothetical protein [Alcanivoracaceae bacterium]